MKPCLDPGLEIGARAAVAIDAGIEAASIGIVMMADQTVDGSVFAVVEVQRQRLGARQQRFAEREEGASWNERTEREHRCSDDADHECRVPAEREPARDDRLVRRRSRTAPSSEENRDAAGRRGDIHDAAAVTSGVPTRRDDVSAQEHREQAAENDVRRLEVTVTVPEAPAHACDGCNREHQKSGKGRNATQLVERRRGLQILGNHVVRHHRQKCMKRRRAEGHPTQHFMAAKRKQNRRVRLARPDGAAA